MLFGNAAESKQELPNYQMKVWIPVEKQIRNQPFVFERLVFYALWYNGFRLEFTEEFFYGKADNYLLLSYDT